MGQLRTGPALIPVNDHWSLECILILSQLLYRIAHASCTLDHGRNLVLANVLEDAPQLIFGWVGLGDIQFKGLALHSLVLMSVV